jgi:hypothetical protein
MRRCFLLTFAIVLAAGLALAAAKPHVIVFGKPMTVKFFVGPQEKNTVDMKIRPLYVDNHLKEFTTGEPHDVTDKLFVVRQVYRLNDRLPDEPKKEPAFLWQRGGWLLVDRTTGRVSPVALPDFDPFYSAASWYRDYVAYCGLSTDGDKLYAIVARLKVKKPIVRQRMGEAHTGDMPESVCEAPTWERQPPRVTFAPKGGQKITFTIRGTVAELAGAPE